MKGYHDSKTAPAVRDLWMTPKEFFNYYDKRFDFKLDMAASDRNALCDWSICEEEDALEFETMHVEFEQMKACGDVGAVWCNPPYSACKEWVEAVVEYSYIFKVPFVMLLPADTSVKWFETAFDNCTECHLITGRISFINELTRKPASGNNKGSVVFVFDVHSPLKSQTVLLSRDEIMGK